MSGWSRYDHLSVLCELFPIGIPSLVMGTETILAGKPLNGIYPKSTALLGCQVPYEQGYVYGCNFPGNRVSYKLTLPLMLYKSCLKGDLFVFEYELTCRLNSDLKLH